MTIFRLQHVFAHESGLARDAVTNKFDFAAPEVAPNFGNMHDLVQDFYNDVVASQAFALRARMSTRLSGAWEQKIYRMSNATETAESPTPRLPESIQTGQWVMGGATAAPNLPQEVAVKVSWHAAYVAGVPKARQRGGCFLGPWGGGVEVIGGSTSVDTRPAAALLSDARLALKGLIEAAAASVDVQFVVWSVGARDNSDMTIPYEDRPILAPRVADVVNGWVDNEFDTIRRRGLRATERGIVI